MTILILNTFDTSEKDDSRFETVKIHSLKHTCISTQFKILMWRSKQKPVCFIVVFYRNMARRPPKFHSEHATECILAYVYSGRRRGYRGTPLRTGPSRVRSILSFPSLHSVHSLGRLSVILFSRNLSLQSSVYTVYTTECRDFATMRQTCRHIKRLIYSNFWIKIQMHISRDNYGFWSNVNKNYIIAWCVSWMRK